MKYGLPIKAIALGVLGLGLMSSPSFADNTDDQGTNLGSNGNMQVQSPEMKNLQQGQAFLESNKNKPGVIALPDGLQYKILIDGQGAKPTDGDTVTVHYTGTLINGTVFDSSFKRGQPATFPVNGVIPGWTEALKMMKVGSTWKLYIPAALAYGEQGAPPSIGPNETLIFKVQLISVNKG